MEITTPTSSVGPNLNAHTHPHALFIQSLTCLVSIYWLHSRAVKLLQPDVKFTKTRLTNMSLKMDITRYLFEVKRKT